MHKGDIYFRCGYFLDADDAADTDFYFRYTDRPFIRLTQRENESGVIRV